MGKGGEGLVGGCGGEPEVAPQLKRVTTRTRSSTRKKFIMIHNLKKFFLSRDAALSVGGTKTSILFGDVRIV